MKNIVLRGSPVAFLATVLCIRGAGGSDSLAQVPSPSPSGVQLGDLDKALEELRTAFKYRENVNPGERMPNPLTDPSFKKFLDDARFKTLMEEIGKR